MEDGISIQHDSYATYSVLERPLKYAVAAVPSSANAFKYGYYCRQQWQAPVAVHIIPRKHPQSYRDSKRQSSIFIARRVHALTLRQNAFRSSHALPNSRE